MLISRWDVSIELFDDIGDVPAEGCVALPPESAIYRGLGTDRIAAISADENGIVGHAIGTFEDGSPAAIALYLDRDGNLSHGSAPQPIEV